MEEMLDDTLEGLDEDPELEEEAEEEVDRVLYEITDGKLGVAGAGKELPVRSGLFPTLHFWVLTRVIESQRRRSRRGQRSGDGTDAGSAEQPAQWIIDGLRRMIMYSHIYLMLTIIYYFLYVISRSEVSALSFHLIENLC